MNCDLQLGSRIWTNCWNIKSRTNSQLDFVLQDVLSDNFGGSKETWKQNQLYDFAYNLFSDEILSDLSKYISINNTDNKQVLSNDLQAEELLKKTEITQSTNAGERNRIVVKALEQNNQPVANFFGFFNWWLFKI